LTASRAESTLADEDERDTDEALTVSKATSTLKEELERPTLET
jgi:hypothetical protein